MQEQACTNEIFTGKAKAAPVQRNLLLRLLNPTNNLWDFYNAHLRVHRRSTLYRFR